ncbi:MAG: L,D-transpeptidase [Thermoanaerobaculia bacterium]
MSDRRNAKRPENTDRRGFPRPPLWLNLLLLLLGFGGVLFARYHRERVSHEYADVLVEQQRTPGNAKKIKDELAAMDLSKDALKKELEARASFLSSLKSENFYLSVDTQQKKLRFYYGDKMLREGDITIGESKSVQTPSGNWTFVPLKGSFPIEAKIVDYDWKVPDWVYAMNGQQVPKEPQTVRGGLGKYVIFLPNGYVIHSRPSDDSPLQGAKPGSIMASEDDLRPIWERIHRGTPVYIF